MSIFNRITLQSMKKSPTRTLVTIIGVVLSAAMVTAVTTFGVSLQAYLVNSSIQKSGNWHIAFLDVDSDFVQEQVHSEKTAGAAVFENIGYAVLDGGENVDKPYLFLQDLVKKLLRYCPFM